MKICNLLVFSISLLFSASVESLAEQEAGPSEFQNMVDAIPGLESFFASLDQSNQDTLSWSDIPDTLMEKLKSHPQIMEYVSSIIGEDMEMDAKPKIQNGNENDTVPGNNISPVEIDQAPDAIPDGEIASLSTPTQNEPKNEEKETLTPAQFDPKMEDEEATSLPNQYEPKKDVKEVIPTSLPTEFEPKMEDKEVIPTSLPNQYEPKKDVKEILTQNQYEPKKDEEEILTPTQFELKKDEKELMPPPLPTQFQPKMEETELPSVYPANQVQLQHDSNMETKQNHILPPIIIAAPDSSYPPQDLNPIKPSVQIEIKDSYGVEVYDTKANMSDTDILNQNLGDDIDSLLKTNETIDSPMPSSQNATTLPSNAEFLSGTSTNNDLGSSSTSVLGGLVMPMRITFSIVLAIICLL